MKKFGIFLLGIIVAVIGFYFLSNKTEPLPDNPPSNIEQPGDDNETPTPDNPGDVGSETQYTTNTFYLNDINYISLFEDAGIDGWRSLDTSNGLDNIQFVVGERYNIDLQVNSFYAITEVYYDSSCVWNGRWTEDKSILSIYFTAVENGIFQITTEYVGEIQYTTNTFNIENCGANLYRDVNGWALVDVSNGLDNVQFVVGDRYNLELYPNESYAITEVAYNNVCIWSGYNTDIYTAVSIDFTAVENGIFQVTTQPVNAGSDTQYTTNTFNLGNSLPVDMYVYDSATGFNDCLWPLETELDSYNFVVGLEYCLHLCAIDGYEITEVYYNSNLVYSGDACLTVTVSFRAVENGVFSVITQIIEPELPVNTFSLENIETIAIYESINFVYDKLDTSAGLDNIELKSGTSYRVLLMPKNGFTISSVIYNGETQYRYSDASSSIYAVGFQAVDNATFEVVTEASSFTIGTTTNTFMVYDSNIVNLFKVESDGSLTLVDISNGIENTELTVGQEYCLEVVADEGYTVSSFLYGGVSYTFENTSSSTVHCNFIAANHNGDLIVRCSPVE